MKPKELLRHVAQDIDSRSGVFVEARLRKLFGVAIPLKSVGEKLAAQVDAQNPAVWIVAFQGDRIVVWLVVRKTRQQIGEFDLGSVADAQRRRQIADALRAEGVIDAAELRQFHRAHPDKARLTELRNAITTKLKALEGLRGELEMLKTQLAEAGG
jgi:hypothetical protein